MLYHSLISSHLKYCNIVWGFSAKKNIKRIHRLQKRSIRLITNSPYLSSSIPLFLKLKILPVHEMISLESAIFMFKLSNNMLPDVFSNYFTFNCAVHAYHTRHAQNIHTPLNRITKTQSCIFYKGTILWNSLPTLVKNSKTLTQFKRLFKKSLFESLYQQM